MSEPFRKAVLVGEFTHYGETPEDRSDWYNEIWAQPVDDVDDFDGWATSYKNTGRYLIHPDSDDVKVEPGAIVVLEEVPGCFCSRWSESADHGMVQSLWRIIQGDG